MQNKYASTSSLVDFFAGGDNTLIVTGFIDNPLRKYLDPVHVQI
jgi:hypothetical protein